MMVRLPLSEGVFIGGAILFAILFDRLANARKTA